MYFFRNQLVDQIANYIKSILLHDNEFFSNQTVFKLEQYLPSIKTIYVQSFSLIFHLPIELGVVYQRLKYRPSFVTTNDDKKQL